MIDKRFIIIAGKGGVGRTCVAAALAVVLARSGRRVLLAQARSNQNVGRLLGVGEIGEEIVTIEPNLSVVNMSPEAALREYSLMVLRFKAVQRAVMENRMVKYFLRAVPALQEFSLLGKSWYHTTEKIRGDFKYQTVIFDGPATGHLLPLLHLPQVILEIMPSGPLATPARQMQELLTDPARTAMWLITIAEEMATSETQELFHLATDRLRIRPEKLIVNNLFPDDFLQQPRLAQALEHICEQDIPEPVKPAITAARLLFQRRKIQEFYLRQLDKQIPLPRLELPYLFASEFKRPALEQIASRLEDCLRREVA